MPANKRFNFGPLALTATYTTNILNPGTTTGGVNGSGAPNANLQILINHIRVVNRTGTAATFRLFRGANGGNVSGTEIAFDRSVPANDAVDLYFPAGLLFTTADFLVGGASAGATLTIQGSGEIGVA